LNTNACESQVAPQRSLWATNIHPPPDSSRATRTLLADSIRFTAREMMMPKNFKEAAGFLLGLVIAVWLLLPLVARP
jgi:hypothetical protein